MEMKKIVKVIKDTVKVIVFSVIFIMACVNLINKTWLGDVLGIIYYLIKWLFKYIFSINLTVGHVLTLIVVIKVIKIIIRIFKKKDKKQYVNKDNEVKIDEAMMKTYRKTIGN